LKELALANAWIQNIALILVVYFLLFIIELTARVGRRTIKAKGAKMVTYRIPEEWMGTPPPEFKCEYKAKPKKPGADSSQQSSDESAVAVSRSKEEPSVKPET